MRQKNWKKNPQRRAERNKVIFTQSKPLSLMLVNNKQGLMVFTFKKLQ